MLTLLKETNYTQSYLKHIVQKPISTQLKKEKGKIHIVVYEVKLQVIKSKLWQKVFAICKKSVRYWSHCRIKMNNSYFFMDYCIVYYKLFFKFLIDKTNSHPTFFLIIEAVSLGYASQYRRKYYHNFHSMPTLLTKSHIDIQVSFKWLFWNHCVFKNI